MDDVRARLIAAAEKHPDFRHMLAAAMSGEGVFNPAELHENTIAMLFDAVEALDELGEENDADVFSDIFGRAGDECATCDNGWVVAVDPESGENVLVSCPDCGGVLEVGVYRE